MATNTHTQKTLDICEQWIAETKRYSGDSRIAYLLVGNKSDDEAATAVDDATAQAWAKAHSMPYVAASARADNVEKLFDTICDRVWKTMKNSTAAASTPDTAHRSSTCTLL